MFVRMATMMMMQLMMMMVMMMMTMMMMMLMMLQRWKMVMLVDCHIQTDYHMLIFVFVRDFFVKASDPTYLKVWDVVGFPHFTHKCTITDGAEWGTISCPGEG
ncbi:hypothetical protein CRM22_003523 [Opisthorchis felineus]|uniref:Uncharacterized protein n=1 Tax=Opisthorchis felineus TaxID=147828 RepID=A0A4S2M0T1_OPIFE|nr:hypothetical protein CRM22_003523 [Opisthorchis felineus]